MTLIDSRKHTLINFIDFSASSNASEETIMEKQFYRRIDFSVNTRSGMVNAFYALELKFFMYKLFNSQGFLQ